MRRVLAAAIARMKYTEASVQRPGSETFIEIGGKNLVPISTSPKPTMTFSPISIPFRHLLDDNQFLRFMNMKA